MVNKILHLLLLPLCASVCQRDNSKSWRQIFMNFFGEAGPVTGNNSLDFGDDAHHEADSGIFKRNFTIAGWGKLYEFYGIRYLGGGLRSPSALVI